MKVRYSSPLHLTFKYLGVSDRVVEDSSIPPMWSLYIDQTRQEKIMHRLRMTSGFFISPDISPHIDVKTYEFGPIIPLRPLSEIQVDLPKLLAQRRSSRSLRGPMSFEELSTILVNCCGRTHYEERIGRWLRAYPSPGALYPNDVYLIANHVQGLRPGIYYFNPEKLGLYIVSEDEGRLGRARASFLEKELAGSAAAIFLLVTTMSRVSIKYGEIGLKLALLEAGIITENVVLLASALGLRSLPYESFVDYDLNEALSLDSANRFVAFTVMIGR
ncbi:hypothetical protein GCM10007981_01100 [Thermocladium modestius]|uniref:Nitroreductase domain-containing protein n=1 Tax=Thermocladium modestius TaxID=62609 RepID=A0A830GRR1_9CREN|nr:SagB/ThcOx family dehydrogenase [Thermocladium modestius]GGP19037.1 hypothetical protein GCM10007981_01100 [Thermocladium modestius]